MNNQTLLILGVGALAVAAFAIVSHQKTVAAGQQATSNGPVPFPIVPGYNDGAKSSGSSSSGSKVAKTIGSVGKVIGTGIKVFNDIKKLF
ncbi:MAG TPA: hypothetical protein VF815_28025 [Myxococcaceae bacterium]|jgi:hypothetical protein